MTVCNVRVDSGAMCRQRVNSRVSCSDPPPGPDVQASVRVVAKLADDYLELDCMDDRDGCDNEEHLRITKSLAVLRDAGIVK